MSAADGAGAVTACRSASSERPGLRFPSSASAPTISAAASICEASRRVVDKALDLGITLIDTADIYGNKGGSEEILGKVLGHAAQGHRAGDQIRHADGRCRQAARRIAALYHAGGRSELAAAQDRLDRSLSVAPARSEDADRGNAARARRSGQSRQGPFHRLLQSFGGATRRSANRRRARTDWSSFVTCQDEYSLLDRALDKGPRRRHAQAWPRTVAVFPAGERTC